MSLKRKGTQKQHHRQQQTFQQHLTVAKPTSQPGPGHEETANNLVYNFTTVSFWSFCAGFSFLQPTFSLTQPHQYGQQSTSQPYSTLYYPWPDEVGKKPDCTFGSNDPGSYDYIKNAFDAQTVQEELQRNEKYAGKYPIGQQQQDCNGYDIWPEERPQHVQFPMDGNLYEDHFEHYHHHHHQQQPKADEFRPRSPYPAFWDQAEPCPSQAATKDDSQFNPAFVDFTNPGDIFQFDQRVQQEEKLSQPQHNSQEFPYFHESPFQDPLMDHRNGVETTYSNFVLPPDEHRGEGVPQMVSDCPSNYQLQTT